MNEYLERTWTAPDGVTLAARDYPGAAGSARLPVFCLHGLTRNARDFEQAAPLIAALGRRVLVFDVRGRGRSDPSPDSKDYALPVYCQDVEGWATALGIARAVFVGTSMGGLITMGVAASSPGLVAAAVLNDVGPEIAPAGLARITRYTGRVPIVSTWEEAEAYTAEINGAAFPGYGRAEWAVFARRLFRETGGGLQLDYDPRIAEPIKAAQGPAPDLWPLFDLLAKGRKLLVLRGELSDLLTAETCREMQRRAPDLRCLEVPGVGHAPSLSEPEATDALTTFLKEAP